MTPTAQDWTEAYKEICQHVKSQVPEIIHIDFFRDQIFSRNEEGFYPWPNQSLFLGFKTDSINTIADGVQHLNMRIDFIYVYASLADTFDTAINQQEALDFMKVARDLHQALQGHSGQNFSSLNRVAFDMLESPAQLIVVQQSYNCIIVDYSGKQGLNSTTVNSHTLQAGQVSTGGGSATNLFNLG